jgi:DNA-binding response OmpR family regulator
MRLLLVEDDPRLAQLIGRGLREDGLLVEHAGSASLGSNLAEFRSYDLLLLDVMLPEGPEAGFDLARRLRARGDTTPILFLTARADTDSKVAGLEAGDDYLAKPFDFRELLARVRALVRRSKGVASNRLPLPLGLILDLGSREIWHGPVRLELTPRQYALLECLAMQPGLAYTRAGLIERVWPGDRDVDWKVVDVYVSNLRARLGSGVIETVRGTGYRLGRLSPLEG